MYKNRYRDSIDRSIYILDNYKGKYKITLMINTAYIVLGQMIEGISNHENEINTIYDTINETVNICNDENKTKWRVVRSLRNSLAHYHIEMEGDKSIDKIILSDANIYFEFDENSLDELIHKFQKL